MVENPPAPKQANFPIQLRRVDVGEVTYSCSGFSVPTINPIASFSLETGVSPFDENSKSFQVSVGFIAKNDPEKSGFALGYSLIVRVHGEFFLESLDKFPVEKISQWAQLNGTAVLLSFLRETVYSVTLKSGFKPFILPLMEAPLYKVASPSVS